MLMKSKNQFISDNAAIFLPHCNFDLDKAIDYSERLHARLIERGYTKTTGNGKIDYWSKMTPYQQEQFNLFYDAFNYKKDRAQSVKAFYEIKNPDYPLMIFAASQEAKYRPTAQSKGETPKMCQGWINGSRWEGYTVPKERVITGENIELRELRQDLQHYKSMPVNEFVDSEVKRIQDKIEALDK